jgi:hypothetical protein
MENQQAVLLARHADPRGERTVGSFVIISGLFRLIDPPFRCPDKA